MSMLSICRRRPTRLLGVALCLAAWFIPVSGLLPAAVSAMATIADEHEVVVDETEDGHRIILEHDHDGSSHSGHGPHHHHGHLQSLIDHLAKSEIEADDDHHFEFRVPRLVPKLSDATSSPKAPPAGSAPVAIAWKAPTTGEFQTARLLERLNTGPPAMPWTERMRSVVMLN